MTGTASGVAALLLGIWSLASLQDLPPIRTGQQPLPMATEEPRPWRQPDPRTIGRFPGP